MPHRKAALLADAPAGRHFCQFASESEPLIDSVAMFAASGLERGEAVILVVTPAHARELTERLTRQGLDPASACDSGHLVFVDSVATMAEYTRGGVPDLQGLKSSVDRLIAGLPAERQGGLRIYGELVDLLWQAGYTDAAIQLEGFWEAYYSSHGLCLFCGFTMDALAESTYEAPFGEIGRLHTSVLPTAEDERLRAAVDAATEDVLGISFSLILGCSSREQTLGEHRLPIGRRTMLWLHHNMPVTSAHILERARHYMELAAAPSAG